MKFKISKPRPAPEEHYRWMVDCAVDAIVSTDANGTILTWNKAAAKMFEYTDRDVVDKPLKMLIAGDSIAKLDAILATPIKSSSPIQSHELLGLKKNGVEFPLEVLFTSWETSAGAVYSGVLRDLSGKQDTAEALQKKNRELSATLEATSEGIAVLDLDNGIVDANKKFFEIWKFRSVCPDPAAMTSEITNHLISQVKDPDTLIAQFTEVVEHPEQTYFNTVELNDGRVLERHTQPQIVDGKVVGRVTCFRDVTERQRPEDVFRESESHYRQLFDRNPYPIWVYDNETLRFLAVNEEAIRQYGYKREEFLKLTIRDIRPREDIPELMKFMSENRPKDEVTNCVRHQKKDGTLMEVDVAAHSLIFGGRPARLCLVTDMTERKRAEIALTESEHRLRTILDSMSEGLLQVDENELILYTNNSVCEMTGYSPEELIGTSWSKLLADEGAEFVTAINERRRKGVSDRYELRIKKKSGEIIWVIVGGAPIFNADGEMVGSMGVLTDITERKRSEEQLLHDAFHDALTGLANRTLFMDHLRMTIERGKRERSNMYAVLYLDFDRFKVVNDSLGHAEGDRLLQFIARRLETCTRTGDLVARLGGDEFVILLDGLMDASEALLVAERILADLKTSFDLGGREIVMSTSMGIALSTSGHMRAEDMLRDADIAMYRAKTNGKAQYQIFDQTMHKHATQQLQIETEMRRAIALGEFCLHYQPILRLKNGDLIGFEALLRWNHPERGIILPKEFISVAEETGMILQLGHWTVNESCRQLREWQDEIASASSLMVSVNLSCKEFLQNDLAERVAAAISSVGLDPRCLKLEITESHVMESSELAAKMITRLRDMGVEMSLDDFGTGYSSLSYLHRLPVSYLKIDRSFVGRMTESRENLEIVHTIIKLAKNLRLQVVAEGIESTEQLTQLSDLDCEYGQGFLFSKPLTADAAKQFIVDQSLMSFIQPRADVNAELTV
jgi:diguanylate cyclase (GGDEF)-like protein/PAS domain S-box-containing protein